MAKKNRFGRVFTDLTLNKSSSAQLQVALSHSIHCPRLEGKMNTVQDNAWLTVTHLAQHLSTIFHNHCLRMLPAYTPTATVCMQCTSVVITLSSALTWAQTAVWNVHTAVCSSEFEELVKRPEVLLQCHPPILQRGSVPKDLWYYHRLTSFSFCCLLGNGRCGTQRTQYLWIPNPLLGMWPIP